MAVSVASCNSRIFSISLSEVKLKFSYLRAPVSQDRLCEQLFMRIEREKIKTIQFGVVIEDFTLITVWKMFN